MSWQKVKYIKNKKSFLDKTKKHFPLLLMGFQLPEIVSDKRMDFYVWLIFKMKCSGDIDEVLREYLE